MKLILGLGNPGRTYAHTRHNAGFLALDALAKKLRLRWSRDTTRYAVIAKGVVNETPVLLAKPHTYMNRSGDAARALMTYYKLDIADILVVQDDMDIDPGQMTFFAHGGAAGHNGIASIIQVLGTNAFARLRIGIGRPPYEYEKEDWVLGRMDPLTVQATTHATEAIMDWVTCGIANAMNRWNQKRSPDDVSDKKDSMR